MTSSLQLPETSPVASAEPQVQKNVEVISEEKKEIITKEAEVAAPSSDVPPTPEIVISKTKETSLEATKTKDQSAIEGKTKAKGEVAIHKHT